MNEDPARSFVALADYRRTGHLVVDGQVASVPVSVVITPYAQGRMTQRDIDQAEVVQALASPPSSHGRGKTQGRYEVVATTDRGRLRVVYERPSPEIVLVITTHPEPD